MVLPYAELMNLEREFDCSWSERDVMIYALGLGMPSDPLDQRQLAYVYEKNLAVLPAFISTLAIGRSPISVAGLDPTKALHGEIVVTVHKPMPTSGSASVKARMVGAWDKGPGKGAVFTDRSDLFLEGDSEPFATIVNTAFGRAEGGFGAPAEGQAAPHVIPQRKPDRTVSLPTTRQQALIYRQSGDFNPLHADPEVGVAAGFREPILHGLCTYGICQRAVLGEYCDFAPHSLKHFAVRFTGIVYPGETIRVDMWENGKVISFEGYAIERDQKVIGNGLAILA